VEHDLIEAYLVELRHGLPGRADLDDVLAEVEDHLRLKASRLEAGGLDQLEAQHRALEVFGNPAVVARAFIASPDVPGAVPTRFTKFSGLVAIAAGLAWINLIGLIEFGLVTMLVSASTVRPFAIGAVALTVIALVGSVQRAGGFRNLVIRLVFTGAAIFALALAVPVWMGDAVLVSLLSAVSLLTILALRGSRTGQFGRGRAAMVFQGAWVPTIALSTLIVGWQLWALDVLDWTIDYDALLSTTGGAAGTVGWSMFVGTFGALVLGIAVFATGLIRLGLTLFREPIPDFDGMSISGAG